MRSILFGITIIAIFGLFFYPVFATNISTDKPSYNYEDIVHVSGMITDMHDGQFVILQITNPGDSDIVTADQFLPSVDGSFSKSYPAKGQKWDTDGMYTVKIFYDNWSEVTFQFQNESVSESTSNLESEQSTPGDSLSGSESKSTEQENTNSDHSKTGEQNPKTKIPGFPDLSKSPNHYLERYENESSYQDWFDSQFPDLSIQKVVGYKLTHVSDFPDSSKSPQSYIDRYNNEPTYKNWFDSQFPDRTIYEILGFPEPVRIPSWIKDNADWWSTGQIDDSDFLSGIQYLIEKNIIVIPNLPKSSETGGMVPDWIRYNAGWWAYGSITDDDFVKGLEFLVDKGIIQIN